MDRCRTQPVVFDSAIGRSLGRELDRADPGFKDWSDLIALLDIPEEMALAVQEGLKETGWRTARQPRLYLRNASMRISSREFGIDLQAPKVIHMESKSGLDSWIDPEFGFSGSGGRTTYHQPTDREYDSVAPSGSGGFHSAGGEPGRQRMTRGIRRGGERFGILDTQNIPFRLLRRNPVGKLEPNWRR